MLVDPWPEYWPMNWYAADDVYVGYNNGYYLYNRSYQATRLRSASCSNWQEPVPRRELVALDTDSGLFLSPRRKHRKTCGGHHGHGDPSQHLEPCKVQSRSHDPAATPEKKHDDDERRCQDSVQDRRPEQHGYRIDSCVVQSESQRILLRSGVTSPRWRDRESGRRR